MNTPNSTHFDPHSDPRSGQELDWLAFRYVSGEMTAPETNAFETRLADDQAAREAVAAAVDWLTLTIATAPGSRAEVGDEHAVGADLSRVDLSRVGSDSTSESTSRRRTWHSTFTVLSVAASLVALLGALPLLGRFLAERGGASDEDSQLATAWSASRSTAAALAAVDLATGAGQRVQENAVEAGSDVVVDNGDAEEWLAGSDAEAPMSTPSWMLAGMAALSNEPDESEARPESPSRQEL